MKRFFMTMCICLAVLTMVGSAMANELWDFHYRGADEGLAPGYLPPQGLYFVNDAFLGGTFKRYDNNGHVVPGVQLNGFVDIPVLLWTPGCHFLGADFGVALAQPFDQVTLRLSPPAVTNTLTGSQWGAYGTVLVPFILSWHIPYHLFVSASFSIGLNDGTNSPGDSAAAQPGNPLYHLQQGDLLSKDFKNAYAWAANDCYQFTPTIGISWLYHGWNLSAEFAYTYYTKDYDTDYQTGGQFWADYTLSYTWGKWTIGVGAAQQNQVVNDEFNSGSGYMSQPGTRAVNYGVGPLIGYNFGPCSVMLVYTIPVWDKNDTAAEEMNFRIVVPLGNPYNWFK